MALLLCPRCPAAGACTSALVAVEALHPISLCHQGVSLTLTSIQVGGAIRWISLLDARELWADDLCLLGPAKILCGSAHFPAS
eukprot:18788-Heterococcus_DN1.PRE.2